MMDTVNIEDMEIDLLAEAMVRRYGYDFRHYSRASLTRRVKGFMEKSGFGSPSEMIPRILTDRAVFNALVAEISVTVTEMFRDPFVYRAIRNAVIPHLKTYPFIRIWNAGCATGEEAYAMAILLKEAGLYDKAQIYATDLSSKSLAAAKQGIYPADRVKTYSANYRKAGGQESFSDYFHAKYDSAIMNPALKKNIVFAAHNLATDWTFGEMQFIMCRNVMIYFDQTLQNRVLKLFHESLAINGMLCLGTKENIRFSDHADKFQPVAEAERIYKKIVTAGKRA